MRRSSVRTVAVAVVAFVLTAAPAFAQTASPGATPSLLPTPKASHSWTYYMAIATIGIAALTLILVVIGYLVQAPGFRRSERPARSTQAS
ncbi:MAG TPA: hypothetical protein VJ922_09340 [Actinomycetota bacterium]|nr:hypothetical protein [Actinomycetota bacterium]